MGGRIRSLVVVLLGTIAISVGLLWFGAIFVHFRDGMPSGAVDLSDAWAFDLEAYLEASRRLATGGSLYARDVVTAPFEPGAAGLYYYAPPLGVALLPLADMPIGDSSALWYVLRITGLLAACLLMPVKPVIRALAFLAVSFTLWSLKDAVLGNVSILLVLPLVVAWRWMDRPLGSVALALAASMRPGLALFLLWHALRRRWRALAWTIASGLGLILLTLPFVGIESYGDYVAVVGNLRVPVGPSENEDLGAVVRALGGGQTSVMLARAMSIGLGIGAMALSVRRGPEVSFMVTLCASLLVVPLLWHLYLLTLIVPIAFLADRLRPAALLLMLASWLPGLLSPFLLVVTIGLLLLVGESRRAATPSGDANPSAAQVPADGTVPL